MYCCINVYSLQMETFPKPSSERVQTLPINLRYICKGIFHCRPILKTPNISTISTNPNLKNFQGVFRLSRTVLGSTNMLTLWRLVRNATYLISLNLLHFRNIHWLFETRCLCLCQDSKKRTREETTQPLDHHGRLSCDWKFSRVDLGNLTGVDPILCFPILAYDHITFLQ